VEPYLLWLRGVPGNITGIVALHHSANVAAGAMEPADVVQLADRIVQGGESARDIQYLAAIGLPSWTAPFPGAGKPPCGLVTI